jgi:hypothetical protein
LVFTIIGMSLIDSVGRRQLITWGSYGLDEMIDQPSCARMPCLLLYGESGMGKTMIVEKFERMHPPRHDRKSGIESRPVIIVQFPSGPDERRFFVRILHGLGARYSAYWRIDALERAAMNALALVHVQILSQSPMGRFGDFYNSSSTCLASSDEIRAPLAELSYGGKIHARELYRMQIVTMDVLPQRSLGEEVVGGLPKCVTRRTVPGPMRTAWYDVDGDGTETWDHGDDGGASKPRQILPALLARQ